MRALTLASAALVPVGVAAGSWLALHSWLGRWGATTAEQRKALPGDELLSQPTTQYTMAITIDAPPADIWPWLVQMGVDRAGLYSYLFIENTLFRLGVQNADRIHPEWQDLAVGDHIWFVPPGMDAGSGAPHFGPLVVRMEPPTALVMRFGELDTPIVGTWQFILEPAGTGSGTRLLLRGRGRPGGSLVPAAIDRILEPGYLIMNRGMLLGIKQRVERTTSRQEPR